MAALTDRTRRGLKATSKPESRTHYLIVGLAIGGLWVLNRDKSLLFHAVQMLAVMSALTALQIVLRRRAGQRPPYVRLVVAKLGLVGLAVGVQWLLTPETTESNTIVAAGLVVVVTAVGPVLDRFAVNHPLYMRGRPVKAHLQQAETTDLRQKGRIP